MRQINILETRAVGEAILSISRRTVTKISRISGGFCLLLAFLTKLSVYLTLSVFTFLRDISKKCTGRGAGDVATEMHFLLARDTHLEAIQIFQMGFSAKAQVLWLVENVAKNPLVGKVTEEMLTRWRHEGARNC